MNGAFFICVNPLLIQCLPNINKAFPLLPIIYRMNEYLKNAFNLLLLKPYITFWNYILIHS